VAIACITRGKIRLIGSAAQNTVVHEKAQSCKP
jgi:hypothetical protein